MEETRDTIQWIDIVEAERLPPLSAEEELELCKRMEAGDMQAKKHLQEGNIRRVVEIVRDCTDSTQDMLAFFQEGKDALQKAIETYDYREGYRLEEWAKQPIYDAVLDAKEKRNAKLAEQRHTEQREEAFYRLTLREREIMRYRFGPEGEESHTLEETAQRFGTSRERMQIWERRIFRKLCPHPPRRRKPLKDFLD